jgi:hypothetical protein
MSALRVLLLSLWSALYALPVSAAALPATADTNDPGAALTTYEGTQCLAGEMVETGEWLIPSKMSGQCTNFHTRVQSVNVTWALTEFYGPS